ncbi:hypothetical protein ACYUMT_07525 [Latilactobacillus sakei]
MSQSNFKELKRKHERGATNTEFLDEASKTFADYEAIVIVGKDSDGVVTTYRTTDSDLLALGLLDVSKSQLMAEMEVD